MASVLALSEAGSCTSFGSCSTTYASALVHLQGPGRQGIINDHGCSARMHPAASRDEPSRGTTFEDKWQSSPQLVEYRSRLQNPGMQPVCCMWQWQDEWINSRIVADAGQGVQDDGHDAEQDAQERQHECKEAGCPLRKKRLQAVCHFTAAAVRAKQRLQCHLTAGAGKGVSTRPPGSW